VTGFGGAELLGWTPTALHAIGKLRGWTETAIERLELAYLADQHRVAITVREQNGDEVGELHYDPTGRRHPKMLAAAGTPRALFPPPELIADDELGERRVIWLVEGEPDAIRMWSIGLPAVAVPGAQNWRDEWAARFTGRRWRVAVCFDCDTAGREGAARAAAALTTAGIEARLVELDPDRDDGFDLTDYTADAGIGEERDQAARLLDAIADGTDIYQPEIVGEHGPRPWRSVTWSTFRDTAPPAHRWLIDGLLPAGSLCFIAGPPKRGKTWLGISIALSIALGLPFAGEHQVPTPQHVLYVALEGSQTGLRTRIGALARGAGADPDGQELDRLHMLYRPRPFDLAELATSDWLLEEAIDLDARLIFVDVLRAAARFKENVAEEFTRVRDHLEPLLADERTVGLLHHFGKLSETQKERSPGERMAGTGAMYGALDVGFLITRSEDAARRLGVLVEARDFAAPDALNVMIDGEGRGKHGGFTYADTATFTIDESITEIIDYTALAEALFADGVWRAGDDLASELGYGRVTIEAAFVDDAKRRAEAELEPRIVRWDRDGREVGMKAHNARPWGTPAMIAAAETARSTLWTEPTEQRDLDA
jgi:hypothetical protein